MSWQGNELFEMIVEHQYDKGEWQRNEMLKSLLDIYDAHGRGWYLTGYFLKREWITDTEDDFDPFNPKSYGGEAPWCSCWLPNPFMHPAVTATWVRNAADLIDVAFEAWDSKCDCCAYAGDGDEPLERMVVYGKEYDMRPERSVA